MQFISKYYYKTFQAITFLNQDAAFLYTFFSFSQVFLCFFPLQEMKLSEPVPFYGRYINNIILTSAGGILIPPSSSSNDSLMMPSFIAPFLTSMPPSGKFSMFYTHNMVFSYQNCTGDLISIRFEITRTIYSNSERSEQFLVTECRFNLFLQMSQIS